MAQLKSLVTKTFLGFTAALVTLFFPGMAFAETVPDPVVTDPPAAQTTTIETTPPAPEQGPKKPPGAEGKKYTYNPETGMWESEHYIWDPVTKKTTPKQQIYTFDPVTGRWSTDTWNYDAPSGTYQKIVVPAPDGPPQGVVQGLESNPACGCAGDGTNSTATSGLNANTAVSMVNGLSSTAISGGATVAYNTLGGNALSGGATVMSNTVNLLQSGLSLNGSGAAPTTFVANIEGNVSGDLVIDPSLLALLQPAGGQPGGPWGSLNIDVENDTAIKNDIDLHAGTGDAKVVSNTTGGDATTGDAHAVANVMNMANSNINSAGAFIGTINIFGDLDGDILLPPGVLDALLATDAPTMTLDTSKINGGNLIADFTNNTDIANNVNAYAQSGAATVANNTTAGNATTGNSDTNVTILNLTGHEVIGQNTLLVFVNVLGKWVGALINAPGTSAAAYTGGATSHAQSGTWNLDGDNNTAITNNIDVSAVSGDATVAKNTTGGNATTGDATASANILNVSKSNLSLTGWLGILFINVFGTWTGHFNEDTAAGDPPAVPGVPTPAVPPVQSDSAHVFSLDIDTTGNYHLSVAQSNTSTSDEGQASSVNTIQDSQPIMFGSGSSSTGNHTGSQWGFALFGLLISLCLVIYERVRTLRNRRLVQSLTI